ncbi:MAG: DUF6029 family protein [Bacteroidetes bacterium]|nr:DUF6029 family protein [Bacteroidota bacterium]
MKKLYALFPSLLFLLFILPFLTHGQDLIKGSQVSGSFQADAQYYLKDSKMGITDSSIDGQLTRMNGFTEINYSFKNFTAGMRFEAYLPPLVGFDPKYQGYGVPYWFLNYKNDKLEITAGNFYEQFGNGLTLRTWQEWTLGFDNSLRGLRVKFTPVNGITLKGVWGVQRNYWEPYSDNNRGIVKGGDLDIFLNDLFAGLKDAKTKISFGGSFVSDYQRGKTTDILVDTMIYTLKLPENVAMYSGRLNLNVGGVNFYTEYAHKINDPSSINKYIYKDGNGIFTTLSYSQKGLGIQGSMKIIDNMSYKSNRLVTNNQLDINYLPSITKQHTYALAAMYPYATQPMGEFGVAGTFTYTFKRNTKLGGKSGLTFAVNFSNVNSLSKDSIYVSGINETTINQPGTLGYKTNFFTPGKEKYYQDLNIEVDKKFSKRWKGIFMYLYQTYNKDVVEGHLNEYGIIYSNIGIADITCNLTNRFSLRGEFQGLWTKQDKGNWAAGLLEFTIAPQWFFSIQDQWNYGNSDKNLQLHYYLFSAGYTYNTSRIALSYGRQREGILCVGGVCRYVPAASGLTLTITSSF